MTEWKIGDIVQINPEIGHKWGGYLVIVTEPKSFGCQGILLSPKEFVACKIDGIAYARVKHEDCVYCGHCEWMFSEPPIDDEKVQYKMLVKCIECSQKVEHIHYVNGYSLCLDCYRDHLPSIDEVKVPNV